MLASLSALSLAGAGHGRYSSAGNSAGFVAFVLFIVMLELLLVAAFYVGGAIAWMGVYTKAGYPWWVGLVPFYNSWVLVKIGGRPESNFWLQIIPYAGIYWTILSLNNVSRSFGKDPAYTVGLLFLPWVFASMLSFGQARYLGPSYVDPARAYQGYPQGYAQPHGQPQGYYQPPAAPQPPYGQLQPGGYGQPYPPSGGIPTQSGTPGDRPESGPRNHPEGGPGTE
ncbi:DUF5684 domain-containing protein [Pseudarthrobacter sp. P1]|uniref:DUF5684 domain-containing protein n=1 Tax=Pseudarthrobacter sp. P1 TaxID=3418418 RepID=UPI003CEE768D